MISNEDTLFGTISIAGMPVPTGESGVKSFNTRTGHVRPQQGDYSYEMVGAMQHKELLTNSDILQIWGDN